MYQYGFRLFLLIQLYFSASEGIFFHERSYVTLTPGTSSETFGFSLAYQNGIHNLVVGAPHSSRIGKVFNCPLSQVLSNRKLKCNEAYIDVDKLAPYDHDYVPNVKMNLGYSVSARDDYFLTCAPLWTQSPSNTLGTCFLYNDTAYRLPTFLEVHKDELVQSQIPIGNGWNTLVDDDWLMISTPPDVTYVNASEAFDPMESLIMNVNSTKDFALELHFKKFRNVGFSFAAGKFYSQNKVYAISAQNIDTIKGAVHLIDFALPKKKWLSRAVVIKDRGTPGSMFGASLCSAHLNSDEMSELLVGAPAWGDIEDGNFETGAVHIYLGGLNKDFNNAKRRRSILGDKDGSRFGSAIATSDLDGDGLSEIFVSAPYENAGEGMLYIFSGFEVNKKLIKADRFKKMTIAQLTRTQKIHNKEFKSFGYSLQVIPDVDGNGCDELAIGSPKSQNIMFLRCIPSVKVVVDAEYKGSQLKIHDKSFKVKVCVSVHDSRNRSLAFSLTLHNEVEGNKVYIENNETKINIGILGTDTVKNKCMDIIAKLVDYEPGDYEFRTRLTMDENKIVNSDVYDLTWGLMSPYSKLEARAEVSRRCTGSDCDPRFIMDLQWSGGKITKGVNGSSYDLASSAALTATLLITNEGNSSWEACALINVTGAVVSQIGCVSHMSLYKCLLPRGFMRNTTCSIDIKFDMSHPKSLDEEIDIDVHLYDFCDDETKNITTHYERLKLNLDTKDILLSGSGHDQYISDINIQDHRDSNLYRDAHEYWVENKGNITWINVIAKIAIYKEPFIKSTMVTNGPGEDFSDRTEFSFSFDLPPGYKEKTIALIDIAKDKIMENLQDNKVTIKSTYILYLHPTSVTKQYSVDSNIMFKKEMQLGQNKSLIIFLAVLVAMIIMAAIIFLLYKMQFFKSAEKEKLEELKQNQINRQSAKSGSTSACNEAMEDLDMEVDEDDAFEIVDMTTPVLKEDTTAL